jgi:RNA-binding protein YhbY
MLMVKFPTFCMDQAISTYPECLVARIDKLLEAHELLKMTLRESEHVLQQDYRCAIETNADKPE